MYSADVTTNKSEGQKIKAACAKCDGATNHEVISSVDISGSDEDYGYQDATSFQLIKCLGCDEFSFRKTHSNSEDMWHSEDGDEGYIDHIEIYPPRVAGRSKISHGHALPFEVKRIYDETHMALCNKQPILTGIGIRALIEAICNEKKASGASLAARIDALVAMGVLTKDGAKILHSLRTMGNSAAHEVKPHSEETLGTAMDVVENLLSNVYVLPYQAKKIK